MEPIETFIRDINPDVVLYTQVSAGLALGLGALSLFLVLSIFIRVCKCEVGAAVKCIFAIVSQCEMARFDNVNGNNNRTKFLLI